MTGHPRDAAKGKWTLGGGIGMRTLFYAMIIFIPDHVYFQILILLKKIKFQKGNCTAIELLLLKRLLQYIVNCKCILLLWFVVIVQSSYFSKDKLDIFNNIE